MFLKIYYVVFFCCCCSVAAFVGLSGAPFSFATKKRAQHSQTPFHWHRAATKDEDTKKPTKRRSWDESYSFLVKYHERHGHANVPWGCQEDPKLARWVGAQRKRRHSLKPDKIALLEALHFTWVDSDKEKIDHKWQAMFQSLQEFKEKAGHCVVPMNYPPNLKLANWVFTQRRWYTMGKIQPDRFQKLESIGFVWRLKEFYEREREDFEEQWEVKFEELVEYRNQNGHCRVLQHCKENPSLGHWVHTQRKLNAEDRLTVERKQRLEEIDFTWNFEGIFDEAWHIMYNHLLELKEVKKDTKAPSGHLSFTWASPSQQPGLRTWELNQQDSYKRGTLDPQRESVLDEIGYWRSVGIPKTLMYVNGQQYCKYRPGARGKRSEQSRKIIGYRPS